MSEIWFFLLCDCNFGVKMYIMKHYFSTFVYLRQTLEILFSWLNDRYFCLSIFKWIINGFTFLNGKICVISHTDRHIGDKYHYRIIFIFEDNYI